MSLFDRRERIFLITPVFVANNFLKRGRAENVAITPLKLQKLVYFLYREYYKRTDELLFSERFETWKYGPVVPSIYAEFSSYGNNEIKSYATDSRGKCFVVTEDGVFKESIDKVWAIYGGHSGEVLSALTHKEGTAWTKAKDAQKKYLNLDDIKKEEELYAG